MQESDEFFGSVTSPTFFVSLFPFMKYRNIFFKLAGAHQCIGKETLKLSNPTRELTHQEFPDRLLSEVLQTLAEVDQQSVVEPEQ